MRDPDELASSGVLGCPLAAPLCDTRAGALEPTSDFFRPLLNLLPSLGRLALSSLLLCVAITHPLKKQKADLISGCLISLPLLLVRHGNLCDAYFSASSR